MAIALALQSAARSAVSLAILGCLCATASNAGARHVHRNTAIPIILRIDPSSLLFETDAATASVVSPKPYPAFLHVYGRNFKRGTRIYANDVLITTMYVSRIELRGSISEIDATLKTDADNDRRTYADIHARRAEN